MAVLWDKGLERGKLERVLTHPEDITKCDGWRDVRALEETRNVSEWVGPRLSVAVDLLREVLGKDSD